MIEVPILYIPIAIALHVVEIAAIITLMIIEANNDDYPR